MGRKGRLYLSLGTDQRWAQDLQGRINSLCKWLFARHLWILSRILWLIYQCIECPIQCDVNRLYTVLLCIVILTPQKICTHLVKTQIIFLSIFFFFFSWRGGGMDGWVEWDRVLVHSPNCPKIHYVNQASLKSQRSFCFSLPSFSEYVTLWRWRADWLCI